MSLSTTGSLSCTSVDPDAQIAVVLEYLSRIAKKTRVIACSGNHDLNARNDLGERSARWLDAARESGVFVDGTSFGTEHELVTVCPWWDGPLTLEVVGRQLEHDAALVGDRQWIDRIGSTLVLNAGRQIGPVPTCIEIDTDADARWSSLAGFEEKAFAAISGS